MKVDISYSSDKPMYEQIKDSIKNQIYSGKLQNNDPLPSMRQLAKDLNISMITTKRAYVDLESEGFVYSVTGRGTFIKINDFEKTIEEKKAKILDEMCREIAECKKAGIPKTALINKVEDIYGGVDNE